MRIRVFLWTAFGLPMLLMFLNSMLAQSSSGQPWKLPHETAVKDAGPRSYKFVVDYNIENTKGEVVSRERVTGEYTRGLAGGDVMWKNVAIAKAEGAKAPFGNAEKRDFMEGFRYRNDMGSTLKPEFFKGFPATAVNERNLVWDTGMFEHFGQDYLTHLKLNEPYHSSLSGDVKMPEVGMFHNRDIVLEWIGSSQRNGHDCALIKYQAFFNPLEIVNSGMTLNGRSDYWGEIWVSLSSRQIEYATLYENVTGEMKLAGQEKVQIINVLRIGTFEPIR